MCKCANCVFNNEVEKIIWGYKNWAKVIRVQYEDGQYSIITKIEDEHITSKMILNLVTDFNQEHKVIRCDYISDRQLEVNLYLNKDKIKDWKVV